jgi:hypothetical protein
MNSSWRIIAIQPDEYIAGVLRLKDGKKFFLGDITPHGPISSFSVYQGSIQVELGLSSVHGIKEIYRATLKYLEELP